MAGEAILGFLSGMMKKKEEKFKEELKRKADLNALFQEVKLKNQLGNKEKIPYENLPITIKEKIQRFDWDNMPAEYQDKIFSIIAQGEYNPNVAKAERKAEEEKKEKELPPLFSQETPSLTFPSGKIPSSTSAPIPPMPVTPTPAPAPTQETRGALPAMPADISGLEQRQAILESKASPEGARELRKKYLINLQNLQILPLEEQIKTQAAWAREVGMNELDIQKTFNMIGAKVAEKEALIQPSVKQKVAEFIAVSDIKDEIPKYQKGLVGNKGEPIYHVKNLPYIMNNDGTKYVKYNDSPITIEQWTSMQKEGKKQDELPMIYNLIQDITNDWNKNADKLNYHLTIGKGGEMIKSFSAFTGIGKGTKKAWDMSVQFKQKLSTLNSLYRRYLTGKAGNIQEMTDYEKSAPTGNELENIFIPKLKGFKKIIDIVSKLPDKKTEKQGYVTPQQKADEIFKGLGK